MLVGEKLRLYPTKEQEEIFRRYCGTARFVYNKCLAEHIRAYEEEGITLGKFDLVKYAESLKYNEDLLWLKDISSGVVRIASMDLFSAFKRFFSVKGTGFPKFKKKGRCKEAFGLMTNKSHCRFIDNTHLKLSKIKEPVRVQNAIIPDKLGNPRVSFDGKYWYFSYTYEVNELNGVCNGETLGIDLGVKSLAVVSNGKVYKNINKTKRVRQLTKRKKHLQRKLANKFEMNKENCSTSKTGKKFIKTNNIEKLKKKIRLLDRKLRNIRDTYIHQVTYDVVKTKPKNIVIEDLNVRGMLKNRHQARAIQEECFYKFRQYITYKCKFYGINLIIADRFFPSSKKCSCCGRVKKLLPQSERTYVCECGFIMDRDLNASINLRDYGLAQER